MKNLTAYWRCTGCQTVFAGYEDEDGWVICDEQWSTKRCVAGCPICGAATAEPWTDEVQEEIQAEMDEEEATE